MKQLLFLSGGPYEEAVHCLERALENLPDHDYFTVCVFDHHAVYFKQDLVTCARDKFLYQGMRAINHSLERRERIRVFLPHRCFFDTSNSIQLMV